MFAKKNKELVILKSKFTTESRRHRVYLHDEHVNHEGLKGVFTKDTKGWMGCEFEGGHEGIASQFDLQLCFYVRRLRRFWIGIKVRRVVNKSLKGLHITAQGFNPGYRTNVNQSAVGATYSFVNKYFKHHIIRPTPISLCPLQTYETQDFVSKSFIWFC